MSDDKPADMTNEVYRLSDRPFRTGQHAEKQEHSRAFAPKQQVEVIRGNGRTTGCVDPDLNGQLKAAAKSNIQHFIDRLCTEADREQRQTLRQLVLEEERWFGSTHEWREMIQRLLSDCDGRVLRYQAPLEREQAAGVATREAQMFLDNLLEVQRLLRHSLHFELPSQQDGAR